MKHIFFIGVLLFTQLTFAQEKIWTMEECIRYAIEHNPGRAKQEAQNTIYKINQQQAVAGFFPSLNASSSVSANFGRVTDQKTNAYISANTFYNPYSISSSMTLFDGLSQIYRAQFAKINRLMGKEQLQDVKDQIALDVMTTFFDVLYYKGTVHLAEQQLEESATSLKQVQRMEELGMKAAPDVAEIRATDAQNRYLLTQQRNLLRIQIIKLKEKMNFPIDEDLLVSDSIEPEAMNVSDTDAVTIFEQAKQFLPKILSAEQSVKATEAQYKIARGQLFPSLSLQGGFNTSFYRMMDNSPYESFKSQLKNRLGSYIGVGISIPIFDNLSRSANRRVAKQQVIIARSNNEATLRQIYSEIEQAVADVRGLRDESQSAHEKTLASLEAQKVNLSKYEEGLISALELTTSANRLLNARVEELHTGLQYQLKSKLLNYYKGVTSWTEF